MTTNRWQLLGPPSADLYDARLQLHHALQVAAAAGHTFVPKEPDHGHSSFTWQQELQALVGRAAPQGFRAGLRFSDLTLLLLDEDARIRESFPLIGRTQGEGYAWLAEASARLGAPGPLTKGTYGLPEHPTAVGAAFAPSEEFAELARWYGNAALVLEQLRTANPGASPLRCWPHHFDIATLIGLDQGKDPEAARSIGVGMTPGDGGITEPYWYVTPWPYPAAPVLPQLPGNGAWNTEGWLGAVLRASQLVSGPTPEAQAEQAVVFLSAGVAACKRLLGA